MDLIKFWPVLVGFVTLAAWLIRMEMKVLRHARLLDEEKVSEFKTDYAFTKEHLKDISQKLDRHLNALGNK